MSYRYGLVNRPPGLGAVPKGYTHYETSNEGIDGVRHGILTYDHELSPAEVKSYELLPLNSPGGLPLEHLKFPQAVLEKVKEAIATHTYIMENGGAAAYEDELKEVNDVLNIFRKYASSKSRDAGRALAELGYKENQVQGRLQARHRLLCAGNALMSRLSEMGDSESSRLLTGLNVAIQWMSQQGEGTHSIGKIVTASTWDIRPAIEAFHWLSSQFAPNSVEGFEQVYAVHDMIPQVQLGRQLEITPYSPLLAFSVDPVIDMLDRDLNHTKDILIRLRDPLVIFSWNTFDEIDLPGAAQTIPRLDPLVVAMKKLKACCAAMVPDKIVLVLVGNRPFKVDVAPPEHKQEEPEGDFL